MSLNGSGAFIVNSTGQPVVANTLISAVVFNAFTADVAAALSTAIYKDGQQTVTANIPLGGFKITGLGDASNAGDALRFNGAAGTPTSLVLTNATGLPAAGVTGTAVVGSTLQGQTYTAFTTGGTSTAYTLTPTPAITANAANQRFRVKFHAAAGTMPTLAISGQPALSLRYRDSTGAKQVITSEQVPINWESDVVNDGTNFVVLEIPGPKTMTATVGGLVPTPPNNTTTFLRGDGTFAAPPSGITLGTQVSTTSGTSKDFTSIPAGTKRITVEFDQVSTNTAATIVILQLGTGGTPKTSDYVGASGATSFTTGIGVSDNGAAADTRTGCVILTLMDSASNKWVASGTIAGGATGVTTAQSTGGVVSLAGVLDMIRVTTIAGTAAFDNGNINITYE